VCQRFTIDPGVRLPNRRLASPTSFRSRCGSAGKPPAVFRLPGRSVCQRFTIDPGVRLANRRLASPTSVSRIRAHTVSKRPQQVASPTVCHGRVGRVGRAGYARQARRLSYRRSARNKLRFIRSLRVCHGRVGRAARSAILQRRRRRSGTVRRPAGWRARRA
jgi:hypothetical protein